MNRDPELTDRLSSCRFNLNGLDQWAERVFYAFKCPWSMGTDGEETGLDDLELDSLADSYPALRKYKYNGAGNAIADKWLFAISHIMKSEYRQGGGANNILNIIERFENIGFRCYGASDLLSFKPKPAPRGPVNMWSDAELAELEEIEYLREELLQEREIIRKSDAFKRYEVLGNKLGRLNTRLNCLKEQRRQHNKRNTAQVVKMQKAAARAEKEYMKAR